MKKFVVAMSLALAAAGALAAVDRSAAVIKQFKENNVCPSTGIKATNGKPETYVCPGWVVDHGIPRCSSQYGPFGADASYNLFYQKYDAQNAKMKDKDEVALCNRLKQLTNEENQLKSKATK